MGSKLRVYTFTFQFSRNYGAMLQAYALQTFLKNNGCDVQIVDYWPDYAKKIYHWYSVFANKPTPGNFFRTLNIIRATTVFNLFKKRYLCFTRRCLLIADIETLPPADVIIAGSDQVWNPALIGEYNDAYFLKFKTTAVKASYAASAGQDHFSEEELKAFAEYTRNMDFISVREKTFCEQLRRAGVPAAQHHLDPVFLLSREDYRRISTCGVKGKYILVYYCDQEGLTDEAALRLSKLHGNMPVYRIGKSRKAGITGIQYCTVNAFLGLIDHAEYVVSSSFHATAFAVIFRKQFYAVCAGDRSSRLTSMLEQFGLADRYISHRKELENLDKASIDYAQHEQIIEHNIEKAKEYLHLVLREAEYRNDETNAVAK